MSYFCVNRQENRQAAKNAKITKRNTETLAFLAAWRLVISRSKRINLIHHASSLSRWLARNLHLLDYAQSRKVYVLKTRRRKQDENTLTKSAFVP